MRRLSTPPLNLFSTILLLASFVSLTFSADSDRFVRIGKGTLLSVEGNSGYRTILYGNVGATREEVKTIMKEAAREHDDICVGFMTDTQVISQGILLYDESKIDSSSWPPTRPSVLANAAQMLLTSYWPTQMGRSIVSLTSSKNSNQVFSKWKAFAKIHLIAQSYVGEGTLISNSNNAVFSMMQFTGIATSLDRVREIMERASFQAGDTCVGYHIMESTSDASYLSAGLIYDGNRVPNWPMAIPNSLRAATGTGNTVGQGSGEISFSTSVAVDGSWSGWRAYAKLEMMHDPTTYIGEGTLIDDRGKYYGIVRYSGIANSEKELWVIIRQAYLECGSDCVGFQYRPVNDNSYMDAALLYDRQKVQSWPPGQPASLSSFTPAWTSRDDETHQGYGSPSSSNVDAGLRWEGWRCYASAS